MNLGAAIKGGDEVNNPLPVIAFIQGVQHAQHLSHYWIGRRILEDIEHRIEEFSKFLSVGSIGIQGVMHNRWNCGEQLVKDCSHSAHAASLVCRYILEEKIAGRRLRTPQGD